MHIPSAGSSNLEAAQSVTLADWVAFQLHTVCEAGGLRATTIVVNGMMNFSCDPTIPSLSESGAV